MLLLVLLSVLGENGIRQCLCTGQVTYASSVAVEPEANCCNKHSECPGDKELPAPCDDGACCVQITFNVIEPVAILTQMSAPTAICPPAHANLDFPAPRALADLPFPQRRPPDRQAVALTVLFSSFLI